MHTCIHARTHTHLGYHTRELDLALGARHVVYLAALPLADRFQRRQLLLVDLCDVKKNLVTSEQSRVTVYAIR